MSSSSDSEQEPDPNVCKGKNGEKYFLQDMFKIVRELLNEELEEEELKKFMRSEMFLEVCPDLHEAFNSNERLLAQHVRKKKSLPSISARKVTEHDVPQPHSSLNKQEENIQSSNKKVAALPITSESSGTDSESETENKHHAQKKKLKKIKAISSNSSSSSSSIKVIAYKEEKTKDQRQINIKNEEKVEKAATENKNTNNQESTEPKKVHPFYLGQMGAIFTPKGKLFGNSDEKERSNKNRNNQQDRDKKKRKHDDSHRKKSATQAKPYSYYSKSSARIGNGKNWHPPREDVEFIRFQKRHKLKPLSILCVDLLKLEKIFHQPGKTSVCESAIPLKRHMKISDTKTDEIHSSLKLKRETFQPILKKLYKERSQKPKRFSRDTSSDEAKDKRRIRRVADSDSSASDLPPPKKPREDLKKSDNKVGWRKADRQRSLEQLRAKTEQKKVETRKLPWEDNQYFGRKKEISSTAENKEKDDKRNKNKVDKFLGKIPKKNAPGNSIQNILQQIAIANQEAAQKPQVPLKIPKLSERPYEYKKPVRIVPNTAPGSFLFEEVKKLLGSNTRVDMPTMPPPGRSAAEFTIRKIGWWFLKSEKDPPDDVLFHPERHDDQGFEDWFDPDNPEDFGVDYDENESIGCVSDPEGTNKDHGEPNLDPDVIDEFCGYSSLQGAVRRPPDEKEQKDMDDKSKSISSKDLEDVKKLFKYLKVRPGYNYEKPNFEAKCFLCKEKIQGQRGLGAHIRSNNHKDNFKNYSLDLAHYAESITPVVPTKVFQARLVEYSGEVGSEIGSVEPKIKEVEIKREIDVTEDQSPDSPMAVIDDHELSPNVVQLKDIPADELSLPSLAMYDLEPDKEQIRCKIALRTAGKWTGEMELRWVKMQEREARITEEYNDFREMYINAPDTHPKKDEEWVKFWDRRSIEVEAEGKDPDAHDYSAEWVPFWLKRVQEIMKIEVECKLLNMKQELKLDSGTLKRLMADYGITENCENIRRNQIGTEPSIDIDIQQSNPSNTIERKELNQNKNSKNKVLQDNRQHKVGDRERQNFQQRHNHSGQSNSVNKKPLSAPPPPKLSGNQSSRDRDRKEDWNSRSRNQREYKNSDKNDRNGYNRDRGHNQTSHYNKDVNRRDNRKQNDRNERSKSRDKDQWSHNKNKIHITTTVKGNKSDESDWETEPNKIHITTTDKGNKSEESDWETEPLTAMPPVTDSVRTVKPDTIPNSVAYSFNANSISLEPSTPKPKKDLALALAELQEAENALFKVDDPLPTSFSVDVSAEKDQKGSIIDCGSFINTSVEMMSVEEGRKKPDQKAVNPGNGPSSPEEGEIDSAASSISMCVDKNNISSFMNVPGFEKRAKQRLKKKNRKVEEPQGRPQPPNEIDLEKLVEASKLDKNSLGYHLLLKNLKGDQVDAIRRSSVEDSSRSRYNSEVSILEEHNPIGKGKQRPPKEKDYKRRDDISQTNKSWVDKKANDQAGWSQQNPKTQNQCPSTSDSGWDLEWENKSDTLRQPPPPPKLSNFKKIPPPPPKLSNPIRTAPPPPALDEWIEESWEPEDQINTIPVNSRPHSAPQKTQNYNEAEAGPYPKASKSVSTISPPSSFKGSVNQHQKKQRRQRGGRKNRKHTDHNFNPSSTNTLNNSQTIPTTYNYQSTHGPSSSLPYNNNGGNYGTSDWNYQQPSYQNQTFPSTIPNQNYYPVYPPNPNMPYNQSQNYGTYWNNGGNGW